MKKIVGLFLFGILLVSFAFSQQIITLTPGGSHNATLQGTTEQRYRVTVPIGRLIAYTESDLDTIMHIYNSAGDEIASDDDSGNNYNARISISVPAGTYTIHVSGYDSDSVGPYTLFVRSETVVSTPITAGRPHNATLQGVSEQIYSITVPAGRLVAYTESNLDTIMRIFNAQGVEVGYDDDSGEDYNARVNINVSAGTFTIEVRGYNSRDTGPYTLHTSVQPVTVTNITLGRPHRATLQGITEQRFTVTVPTGVLIAYTESNLDTVMRIYNAQGNEIAYDDDSGSDRNARISVYVSAGTYTIEVWGYDSSDAGPYTLHTTTEAAVVTNITAGRPHNAVLQGETVQLYSVTVRAGTLVAYTESSLDTVMHVFNAQGEQIAFDDDSGDELNARISVSVPAGTYTIQVCGWDSSDVGPYTLHVLLQ